MKERDFSLPEAARMLGVSESYMKRLDSDWGEVHLARMRRNSRGEPVYSAPEIEVMRKVGIGRRKRPLNNLDVVMDQMGVRSFGKIGPSPEELAREQELLRTAIPATEWLKRKRAEERKEQERVKEEQERLKRQRDEARRQRAVKRRAERGDARGFWRRVFGG